MKQAYMFRNNSNKDKDNNPDRRLSNIELEGSQRKLLLNSDILLLDEIQVLKRKTTKKL